MKFNYDLYRPKKIIQDAWKSNSAYFRSKDVRVTPQTKIGDADEAYKSQSSGRIPALAQRFKRKRLVLSEILPRRKRIFVRSIDNPEKLEVRVSTRVKHVDTPPLKGKPTGRFITRIADLGRELTASLQKNWMAQRATVSQLGLAILVIGAGAGSVHAYINRSHTVPTDSSSQTTNQPTIQKEAPTTPKGATETPPPTPEPPAASTPTPPPTMQTLTPTTNNTPNNRPSSTGHVPNEAKPVPAPQPTNSTTPPAPAPTPPPAPVNEPVPSTPPASPPQPTTPPSNETGTTPPPDETPPTPAPDPNTNEPLAPQTPTDTNNVSEPGKERRSSTEQLPK